MCGRFQLKPDQDWMEEFGVSEPPDLTPRYNIAPTQNVPAVRLAEGKRRLVRIRWGLIPSWAKDSKIAYSTINARADTIATKPAFRSAYKSRRRLVRADGYCEWLKDGKEKQPILYDVDGGQALSVTIENAFSRLALAILAQSNQIQEECLEEALPASSLA